MRKRIIGTTHLKETMPEPEWLNIEAIAEVEISSEDDDYPIEAALAKGATSGWRAAVSGEQLIRLRFDQPQELQRIRLKFEESETERTQEYILRWSADGGQSFHEVVRQQWNFSPSGSTEQSADHQVNLAEVTVLELVIVPDIGGGNAIATLAQWRVA